MEYTSKIEDDDTFLMVTTHSSPWHLYDGSMRIVRIEDMVELLRPALANKSIKRIELLASWSGVRPEPSKPSIAERLSKALNGFPVTGAQGFVWVSPNGKTRTTRQAFTSSVGGSLRYVQKGQELMASAVVSWPMHFLDAFKASRDAEGLLRVGAAWDVFSLCPENALPIYEEAAGLGHAVAAWNAAIIRLERGAAGDKEKAQSLLSKAADSGDAKARALLQR